MNIIKKILTDIFYKDIMSIIINITYDRCYVCNKYKEEHLLNN